MRGELQRIWVVMACVLTVSCNPKDQNKLVIASAANVQFAIKDITEAFRERTGIDCDIIISSSGKLTAQIMEGAPFDVFISADLQYPQKIVDSGLATGDPIVYARGKLVLWSMIEESTLKLENLTGPTIEHIAVANPDVAPYGRAAIEALQYFIPYDQIKTKLVFGESIAQVNQFILSQAVYAGFTAKSVVLSAELKDMGQWIELDPNSYKSIDQGVILINKSPRLEAAKSFKEFLLSDEAARIFENYGYQSVNQKVN